MHTHPLGLNCVEPLMQTVPVLRSMGGVKILWGVSIRVRQCSEDRPIIKIMHSNWGLTDPELKIIPPALVRGFKHNPIGGGWGFWVQNLQEILEDSL